jgi:hypothetical protein
VTERLYLHVGAPKSGTTYVQGVLEHNRRRLADAGVLVVGERHLDRIHAAMVVREDSRLDSLPERASTAWSRLVAEVRQWPGHAAVLSYELFAGATSDQVRRALADLDGIEVHVVITARDLGRSVPSAWQERLKFALTTPLERWRPRPESAGARAEWGWRTMDPSGVAARWGSALRPERVHIVTVPRAPASDDELWRRFAAATGLAHLDLDLTFARNNESLGLVEAELLRRVNERIRPPITGNREQALWLRDTLAHGILAELGREPIGLTDEQFADATTRAADAIKALSDSGYDVQGDLRDLEASRPDARTPSEATDAELLDSAVETIVRLLLLVRERTQQLHGSGPGEPDDRPRVVALGVVALGKGLVRRVAAPRIDRRHHDLHQRIAELEAQVAESRRLHLRVAELADVVTELLLPPRSADGRVTARALQDYRDRSL